MARRRDFLTREICRGAIKGLSAGLDPNELRRGINLAVDTVVKELAKLTKKVTTPDEIAQVACIAGNAFKAVGNEGVITVQTGKTFEHNLSVADGLKVDRGYVAPFSATDPKTMKCEYEKPLVLITDQNISSFSTIQPLLERSSRPGAASHNRRRNRWRGAVGPHPEQIARRTESRRGQIPRLRREVEQRDTVNACITLVSAFSQEVGLCQFCLSRHD
jgi:hypothetical protein